ncbi:MAG: D-aminoacylase [Treponema sp.]|nr:D-aminoacylase [Treponema sp.]
MHDYIIKNVKVFDGTGCPPYFANLAIKNGKISYIGKTEVVSYRKIEGKGLAVSPGFFDAHSHADMTWDRHPESSCKLEQGVTTEIAGTCGISPAPISEEFLEIAKQGMLRKFDDKFDIKNFLTFGAFMDFMDIPFGPNMVTQMGHGALRAAVSGLADRPLTDVEMGKMKDYVHEGMRSGSHGISFGLIYPPGSYSEEPELTELCKVVAEYGGTFSIHMRSEGPKLVESVESVIRMAQGSGARGIISHHKVSGKANWGKSEKTIELIEKANANGIEVFLDQYPYEASSTGLNTMIPNKMHAMGVPKLVEMLSDSAGRKEIIEKIKEERGVKPGEDVRSSLAHVMIGKSESYPDYANIMLLEAAEKAGKDAYELLLDILRDDKLGTGAIYFTMGDDDIERIMKYPRTMVGSDGLYIPGDTAGHPRGAGTFPKFLGHYVRDKSIMSMEEGIRRMTSMPAAVYNLRNKGLLKEGLDADITVFNPDTIISKADYKNFGLRCEGIHFVFVNGVLTVKDGLYNGKRAGKLLRR